LDLPEEAEAELEFIVDLLKKRNPEASREAAGEVAIRVYASLMRLFASNPNSVLYLVNVKTGQPIRLTMPGEGCSSSEEGCGDGCGKKNKPS